MLKRCLLVGVLCAPMGLILGGCPPVTPPEAVLAGDWVTDDAEQGTVYIRFDENGQVAGFAVVDEQDGIVLIQVDNTTTTVEGDDVTITVPRVGGTATFAGTLAADENSMTGTLTGEIEVGDDITVIIPQGNVTFERVEECGDDFCAPGLICVSNECVECENNDDCAEGETCTDGACVGEAPPVPKLEGLVENKPLILPITVQAAYNNDTMFFQLSWEGDRGDTHDYVRFVDGAWQREGGPRRDAQATIDNDPARGATNINSTIYESRAAFMLDDPNGPNAVPDFAQFGCMLTCHDNSRAMPRWNPEEPELSKYLNDDTPGSLDLWHHRLARANPIGYSDDQHVTQVDPEEPELGGRINDTGDGPWQTNDIDAVTGLPKYAFDPATADGLFAFEFSDLFVSPYRSFAREDSADLGPEPLPVGIDYAAAVALGYTPAEDDTLPFRRLRQPTLSRGDITAEGTVFVADADDPLHGRWFSNIQRALNTGNPDDTALAAGGVYNIAFAVHTDKVTVRDHYVGFAMTISLGGGDADIQAVNVAGSGRGTLPDFSDTAEFPETEINLFLPGITSFEFLINENTAEMYIDPVTDDPVDQTHGGANALLTQGLSCRACHTAASSETFSPPEPGGFNAGAMETLVPQRGGVNTPTPIPPGGNGG